MKPLYTQHTTIPEQYINDCFDSFLNEDQAHRDLSTQFLINKQTRVFASLIAEEPLIFAGERILRTIFKKFDCLFLNVRFDISNSKKQKHAQQTNKTCFCFYAIFVNFRRDVVSIPKTLSQLSTVLQVAM